MDAKAALTAEVHDDTERNDGLFLELKANGAFCQHCPGNGLLFNFRIGHHRAALACHDSALLHVVDVARHNAEGVTACGKRDGLPEAIVEQPAGKAAPLRLELDIAMVGSIDVRASNDVTGCDGIQVAPL